MVHWNSACWDTCLLEQLIRHQRTAPGRSPHKAWVMLLSTILMYLATTCASPTKFSPASSLGKRTRDPSTIYETVKEPYSYTTGFHNLTAFVQRRFSANKTLQIAKYLASIRPSFISCTKTLNRQDLIFMEKCFQR